MLHDPRSRPVARNKENAAEWMLEKHLFFFFFLTSAVQIGPATFGADPSFAITSGPFPLRSGKNPDPVRRQLSASMVTAAGPGFGSLHYTHLTKGLSMSDFVFPFSRPPTVPSPACEGDHSVFTECRNGILH